MQITRVELRNIKNHAEAEWDFHPGVTAICGPNGSGKTTIIESIAWALFDHLDYKREDFVKRGTKKGTVVVAFISALDGRAYIVQRDTSGGYFVYDPTTKTRVVEQKNQVRPWLCQHIGVDPGADLSALFKTTIGVPQGAFTYDFTLRPTERKSVFDRILKVDEYRAASDNLRATNRHIENQISDADRGIAEAEGELKIYDETRRDVDQLTAQVESLAADSAAAQRAGLRLSDDVAALDDLLRRIEEGKAASERFGVKLNVARGRLTVAREAAEQARTAASLVAAARAGYDGYLCAAQRLDELETDRRARESLRTQLSGIDRERIETESQILRFQERLTEIVQARADLDALAPRIAEQQRIEAQLAELRESRGARQSVERAVAKLDEELTRLRDRYSEVSRKLETAELKRAEAEQAQKLEDERTSLDRALQECELAEQGRRLKQTHLDRQRTELTRLEEDAAQKTSELARLEALAATAASAAALSADHEQDSERLARLRAETARDAEMITALEGGGICPLLSEKCLNLKPGESLDGRFRTGLAERREEIVQLEAKLPKLAAERQAAERAVAETARLPEVRQQTGRLGQALADARTQFAALETEIGEGGTGRTEEIKRIKAQRARLDAELRAAREAQQVFAQAAGLKQSLQALKDEGGEKKIVRDGEAARLAAFGEIETRLRETETALAALGDPRGRATALRAQIERADEWQRALDENRRRADEIAARHERLTIEAQGYAALDAQLLAATTARATNESDYRTYIANQQGAATAEAREREASESESEVARLTVELAAVDEGLNRLTAEYDGERHTRARRELDETRHLVTQLAARLDHAREQLQRFEKQLAYLDEVRARLREHVSTREKFTHLGETTDFVRDTLQKAAPYLIDSYVFSISVEANQLFREITGRHDVTLRWTREYEITLEEEGRDRPFANLSGGEQMAAALSVRLALLKELSELKLAFFDEPTTNMDEERRRNLAQQIGRIKDFQQLFVISHDDSFEGFTDQIITLGER